MQRLALFATAIQSGHGGLFLLPALFGGFHFGGHLILLCRQLLAQTFIGRQPVSLILLQGGQPLLQITQTLGAL